jgi:hypothetical protein
MQCTCLGVFATVGGKNERARGATRRPGKAEENAELVRDFGRKIYSRNTVCCAEFWVNVIIQRGSELLTSPRFCYCCDLARFLEHGARTSFLKTQQEQSVRRQENREEAFRMLKNVAYKEAPFFYRRNPLFCIYSSLHHKQDAILLC